MIPGTAAMALNHVLRQQRWAADRLKPHAGRSVQFNLGPLPPLRLRIRDDGLLESPRAGKPAHGEVLDRREAATADSAAPGAPADLNVTLKPAALPHLLRFGDDRMREERKRALLREVELAGPADLAQVVQELARDLEWDVEEDLSRLFGDVIAHRVAGAGRRLFAWQQEAGMRLARNFAEYWTEENPTIAGRDDLAAFTASVRELASDVERLEQRLGRLRPR